VLKDDLERQTAIAEIQLYFAKDNTRKGSKIPSL
jgi:hypothetical protein